MYYLQRTRAYLTEQAFPALSMRSSLDHMRACSQSPAPAPKVHHNGRAREGNHDDAFAKKPKGRLNMSEVRKCPKCDGEMKARADLPVTSHRNAYQRKCQT